MTAATSGRGQGSGSRRPSLPAVAAAMVLLGSVSGAAAGFLAAAAILERGPPAASAAEAADPFAQGARPEGAPRTCPCAHCTEAVVPDPGPAAATWRGPTRAPADADDPEGAAPLRIAFEESAAANAADLKRLDARLGRLETALAELAARAAAAEFGITGTAGTEGSMPHPSSEQRRPPLCLGLDRSQR